MKLNFSKEVAGALHFDRPVVALESTLIAHGLPYPQNIETAYKLEKIVRENGATPATIGVFDGEITVGLNDDQIEKLATDKNIRKISRRDLPIAVGQRLNCATTVSSTIFIAHAAGIKIFATGGIGGVHRGTDNDVSADLPELAQTPITVVCSGAKIILDLPATREWLETHGVCVIGWATEEFPAFYSVSSGLPVDASVSEVSEAAKIIKARDDLQLNGAVLIVSPVPEKFAIDSETMESLLHTALRSAASEKISGKAVTPFLLKRLSEESGGKTLEANIALLENNARIAAKISTGLS